MIQVRCAGCSKLYAVPDEYAGKRTRCKQCSAVISIPSAAAPAAPPPMPEPEAATSGDEAADAAPEKTPAEARKPFGKPKFAAGKFSKGGAAGRPAGKPAAGAPRKSFTGGKKFGAAKFSKKGAGGALKPRSPRATEAEGEAPAEGPEGTGDSRKRLILIGGGAVGVIAIAAVVYFAFFAGGGSDTPTPRKKGPVAEASKEAAKPGPASEGTSGGPDKSAPVASSASPSGSGSAPVPVPGAADPSDSLSFIPEDANLVVQVAFGRLRNLPGFDQWIDGSLKSDKIGSVLEESGFDAGSLSTVWLAAKVTGTETAEEFPQPLAILEGTFDREKFIEGLKGASRIASKPRPVEGHDVYPLNLEGETKVEAYLTFLSDTKLLLGESEMFNASLGLLRGGKNVRSNKVLESLSQNFSADKVAWAAFALPEALKNQIKAMAKGGGPMGPGKQPTVEDFSSPGGKAEEATEADGDTDTDGDNDADADADAAADESTDAGGKTDDASADDASAEDAPTETQSETPGEDDAASEEPEEDSGAAAVADASADDAAADDAAADDAAADDAAADADETEKEKPAGGPPGADTPKVPDVDGVFVALDPTPDGDAVGVEVGVQCPTEEDAKSLQKLAAGYILMARMSAPPELKSLLSSLKLVPEGNILRAKVTLPAKLLEQLKAMVPIPGGPPDTASEEESEEGEGEEEGVEPEDGPPAPDAVMVPDDSAPSADAKTAEEAKPDEATEDSDDSSAEIEKDLEKALEGSE